MEDKQFNRSLLREMKDMTRELRGIRNSLRELNDSVREISESDDVVISIDASELHVGAHTPAEETFIEMNDNKRFRGYW